MAVADARPAPFDDPGTDLATAYRQWRACLRADLRHNLSIPSAATILVWRAGMVLDGKRGAAAFLLRRIAQVADAVWLQGVIGAELPKMAYAGPGLRLPHSGRGVIVHPTCRFGRDVTIYQQSTIGVARDDQRGPRVGDGCVIGTGARIIGPITLAPGTRVGTNAVVVSDTIAGGTYVAPAAVLREHAGAAAALGADVPPAADRQG